MLGERGIPDVVLLKSLALVVWLAWTLLLVSLSAEVAASARGLSAPNIAFVGPFQVLAGALVGAIIVSAFTTITRTTLADAPSLVTSLRSNQPATARLVDVSLPVVNASPSRNDADIVPSTTPRERGESVRGRTG